MKISFICLCLSLLSLQSYAGLGHSLLESDLFERKAISLSIDEINNIVSRRQKTTLEIFLLAHLYDLIITHEISDWETLKSKVSYQWKNKASGNLENHNAYETAFMLETWIQHLLLKLEIRSIFLNGTKASCLIKRAQSIFKEFDDEFYYESKELLD